MDEGGEGRGDGEKLVYIFCTPNICIYNTLWHGHRAFIHSFNSIDFFPSSYTKARNININNLENKKTK